MCKVLLKVLTYCMFFSAALCAAAERVMIATPSQGLFEMPVVAAIRNGYFRKEGLEIQKIQIQPQIAVKALEGGDIDLILAWGSSVRAAPMGVPIKMVAAIVSRPLHILVSRPEIRSGRELKAKTLGVDSSAGTVDYLSRVATRYFGLHPGRDVRIIDTGSGPFRLAALKAGTIDASAIDVALAVKAEEEGFKRLLHLGDIIDLPISGIVVTDQKLAKGRQQIKKVIRATLSGTRFIKQNRTEAIRMIQSYLRVTPSQAAKTYDSSIRSFSDDGFISDKAVSLDLQLAKEGLNIAKETPLSQVVDWSLLREIKREERKVPFWMKDYER